jgi:hypothetical protein
MTTPDNDTFAMAMQELQDLRAKLTGQAKQAAGRLDFMHAEEEIRRALDALGREAVSQVLAAADIDEPEITVNGTLHGRVDRRPVRIHTSFGPVEVEQTVYGRGRGYPTVAPMEKQLGLVETYYTPKCAKVLCHLSAVTVRNEGDELLREFGGISVGAATMHRLPLAVMARYEKERDVIEHAVRERSFVPPGAVSMQVGLDGVMVPQDGQHSDPRGREPRGDPDPPRHERRYGILPAGPRAVDDKPGAAWHEASVGTVAFYDADGKHLSTTYVGRMPEEKKATLGQLLRDEAMRALGDCPDLTPVLASDGAHTHWDILAEIHQAMPEAARTRVVWLVDFWHSTEHLQDACDLIDGTGSPRAQVRRAELAETLKTYPDGVDRVLASLRYHRRSLRASAREDFDDVIGFLKNNRYRMAYKDALDANLPIATGHTEAAAKTLVGVRMKRSGARFSQHGGQSVLTLRASLKSHRFDNLFEILSREYKAAIKRAA